MASGGIKVAVAVRAGCSELTPLKRTARAAGVSFTVPDDILERDRRITGNFFDAESLHRTGQFEVKAGTVFWSQRGLAGEREARIDHVVRFRYGVGNSPSPVGTWEKEPVGNRRFASPAQHSSPANPFLIPIKQPTLPELQSVSQPLVLAIIRARSKLSSL